MFSIYDNETVPMKSQKYACLNKTREMTTPVGMQHTGKTYKASILKEL